MLNKFIKRGIALAGVVASTAALAVPVPPDMTPITEAVDFSTVTPAVLAIAGLLAIVYVAVKGAKIGLAMLKGS